MTKRYLENAWYFGGWSNQLKAGEVKELKLAERDLAVYRSESGNVAAIGNRCPHRFAPLHRGHVRGETLECGYHGVRFAADGACAYNPHTKGVQSSSVSVPGYPVVERHGAMWVWLAPRVTADPALIPDLSFLDTLPETAKAALPTMRVNADYQIIVDNLLDPTHAEYLHAGLLGGSGNLIEVAPAVRSDRSVIEHTWTYDGVVAVPVLRSYMPEVEDVDTWLIVRWFAPSIVVIQAGIKPAGAPREESRFHAIYHILAPSEHNVTTYDVMTSRNFALDDVGLTEKTYTSFSHAFNEQDKPMIQAQQEMMGDADFWDLKPALFSSDAPSVRVRRALKAKIDETLVGAT